MPPPSCASTSPPPLPPPPAGAAAGGASSARAGGGWGGGGGGPPAGWPGGRVLLPPARGPRPAGISGQDRPADDERPTAVRLQPSASNGRQRSRVDQVAGSR